MSFKEDRPLFMSGEEAAERRASKLINWGYRKISNNHRLVARLDRPDWYRYMAQKHAPWDPNGEGIDWVFKMGPESAEDHYRRCYSEDRLTVSPKVTQLIPSSNHTRTGYCRKKDEPQSYDVCKGDIPIVEIKGDFRVKAVALVDAYDVQDKWKIHSINVVTGKSHSTSNKFYDSFDDALDRCKGIVKRDPDVQMVILKCTHVVQAMGPPVEVIDLDQLEHRDA